MSDSQLVRAQLLLPVGDMKQTRELGPWSGRSLSPRTSLAFWRRAVLELRKLMREEGRPLLEYLFGTRRMVLHPTADGYRIEGLARVQLDGGAGDPASRATCIQVELPLAA